MTLNEYRKGFCMEMQLSIESGKKKGTVKRLFSRVSVNQFRRR
ncbi:hypothetical protein HCH_01418 [Hahella chejuensis KCTC 2396]|uniref:Uncharacterized protein n=1 Tax=Hahella chejuensis (strain KCTC 2396) TaxID=349521 RepID=Q2SM43_HAHCH|nr:hypothetical protein HCH_01418 [Hahella chejuensis KCTC 2396]